MKILGEPAIFSWSERLLDYSSFKYPYLQVTCADGYSLAAPATENYSITCNGDGKLSCGDQCPTCYREYNSHVSRDNVIKQSRPH